MSTVWVQRVLDWVLFMPCNMRCTQYTVLKSHAVLLTHAVQSPTDRYGYARTANGPRPSSTPTSTTYGTATLSASRSTTYTVHTFPRPVSISHVQPYTDSAAGRPDSDTRQRAVGYDTQLTGACLSTMLSTQFRCSGTPPRPREGTDAASIACYHCTRSNQGDRRSVVSRLSRDGVEVVRHTSLRVKVRRPLLVKMALLISA